MSWYSRCVKSVCGEIMRISDMSMRNAKLWAMYQLQNLLLMARPTVSLPIPSRLFAPSIPAQSTTSHFLRYGVIALSSQVTTAGKTHWLQSVQLCSSSGAGQCLRGESECPCCKQRGVVNLLCQGSKGRDIHLASCNLGAEQRASENDTSPN